MRLISFISSSHSPSLLFFHPLVSLSPPNHTPVFLSPFLICPPYLHPSFSSILPSCTLQHFQYLVYSFLYPFCNFTSFLPRINISNPPSFLPRINISNPPSFLPRINISTPPSFLPRINISNPPSFPSPFRAIVKDRYDFRDNGAKI
jgi:hypothetical protein